MLATRVRRVLRFGSFHRLSWRPLAFGSSPAARLLRFSAIALALLTFVALGGRSIGKEDDSKPSTPNLLKPIDVLRDVKRTANDAASKDKASAPAKSNAVPKNASAINAGGGQAIKQVVDAQQPVPAVPQVAQPGRRGRVVFRGGMRFLEDGESDLNYAIFPTNRDLVRQLERAGGLIAEERFADAFEIVDDILGEQQDFFYQPDREKQVHRSLKAEARQLISGLPKDALEQYDTQFGATARHMLDKAIAEGDENLVAAVARRYFNTQAGFEAAWLLGRQHLDHGQTLAAALIFQILYEAPRAREKYEPALSLTLATCWLRAGVPARAEVVLRELRKSGNRPRVGEKEIPLFQNDTSAVEWLIASVGVPREAATAQLEHWSQHRGNPARNAASSGGSPLLTTPRWQQTLTSEPKQAASGEAMTRQLVDTSEVDLPAETPLAVGDTAIVRTPRWIVGIDLRNGKRVWEYPTWESEDYNPRQQVMDPRTGGVITIQAEKLSTRSTIASDGRAVFVVEDQGNQPFVFPGAFNPWGRGFSLTAGSYNKLFAHELATQGKLSWVVGGESGEEEPRLAGVYFLGAPLAMGGQIYVIGELKAEITLFVLNSATGRLEWSQPLATVEATVALDSFRRLHGAMPSFADGVMVCPTSAGAVVAVDLANRSLLWGYQYPRSQASNPLIARRRGEIPTNLFGGDHWTDGTVILAGGRALVTPADSGKLHCVSLVDGKSVWQVDRKDNLYVGGVHRDTVILVGRRQVQGIKLADGVPAWTLEQLAPESAGMPSGRGFLSAGHYYLPLSSAEVVKIDLADGQIKSRAKSRKGHVPGNLVCYQGNVLSLTEDSLDCYFQLDEREQWAADTLRNKPNDPDALAMFGEILVDQGKLAEGLAQLQRAFELAPNERVRELLVEAHLEALRQDFATHRAGAEQIEQLLTEPAQKSAFARQMALGLQELGETMAAFDHYVKMCQPGAEPLELEPVIPGQVSVRRDRWVRAKIAELRAAVSVEDRRKMDERIEAHLANQGDSMNVSAARQVLDYFGDHESADSLRSALIERLIETGEPLEAEWWLLRQTRSTNRQSAAAAYLRLAELMQRLGRPDDAASCFRQLATLFAEQPVAPDKTARQFVAAISADSPVWRYLAPDLYWPKQVVKQESIPRLLEQNGMQIDVSFGCEPFFSHLALEMDGSLQELLARDGYGRERFRVSLADSRRSNRPNSYSNWATATVRANGHILLIQSGSQVLAVDSLASGKNGKTRILWRHDLSDSLSDGSGVGYRQNTTPNRRPRQQLFDQNNQPNGGIWPIGYELVCLQRGNKLLGIDVFTGQALWTRHDLRPASEIFGDEQYLFVVSPGGNEATVLRTLDGAKLGTRRVPSTNRYSTYGRKIVSFSTLSGKNVVTVHDAWAEKEIWQETFAPSAKLELIDSDEVAVLDPQGRFVIYSLANEKVVVDTVLAKESQLGDLQVIRTQDRYIVLASRQFQYRQGTPHMSAVQNVGLRNNPIVQGRAYGFDRVTGKLSWQTKEDIGPTATLLNQPAHLPMLVFAMNEQVANASGQRGSTVILCLDTRNGQTYQQKLDKPSSVVIALADPEQHSLEVRCSSGTMKLTFGDQKAEDDAAEPGEG